jgi:3-hydroxypropanoate dehydrogenase
MTELIDGTAPSDAPAPAVLGRLDEAARAVLFANARTANSFSDEPVTDDELTAIWEDARWAPTMANTQPLRVLYVRTPEGKKRLVAHMADGNKAKTLSAPAVAVLAVDTRFHDHIPEIFPIRPEMRDVFEANEQMRTGASTYSAALQAGYFILAVRAHGLAAGPMAGYDGPGINQEFFPDGRFQVSMVVNIGHPGDAPWFGRLPRLDHSKVVQWA